MKSKVLYFFIIFLFVGCSTSPQEQLIKDAETFLKSSLNDPSSYQPISITINDTLTMMEYKKKDIENKIYFLDSDIRMKGLDIQSEIVTMDTYKAYGVAVPKESSLTIERYQKELNSLTKAKNTLTNRLDSLNKITIDNSPLKYIYFDANYRTKNEFGSIVLKESHITYDCNSKSFLVYE